jgi:hypothetical protein
MRRLGPQAEHAVPAGGDHGPAEPAAEREEAESDQGEDEPPGPDGTVT